MNSAASPDACKGPPIHICASTTGGQEFSSEVKVLPKLYSPLAFPRSHLPHNNRKDNKPELRSLNATLALLASSRALGRFLGVFTFCCCLEGSLGEKFYYVALDDFEFQSILLPSKHTCLCVCAVLWI